MENKTSTTELALNHPPPPASYPQSSSNSSSSPSHEFSFTISLHHSGPITTIHDDKTSKPNSHLAVDLSPADDIFFHGHLLPLHLLSQQYFPNYSSSPRFSTNSIDNNSFTHLPIRESSSSLLLDQISDTNSGNVSKREDNNNNNIRGKEENKTNKSGSFSLFGLTRGRKGYQEKELDNNSNKEKQQQNNNKKKVGHDVIHALKRYLRMVQQPIVHFRSGIRREKINGFNGQAYSRSGNLMRKSKPEVRGRRGECSAPASMRTSPTNSGLLLATATATATSTNYSLPPAANDSTMEELHAAIQAAIAHCKNSIAKEDNSNTNKQQLLNCS